MSFQDGLVSDYWQILMKRDNNAPSNVYFSPPSPSITFNSYNVRSAQRDSGPVDTARQQQDFQHRYSNNVEPNPSSNAFAHLRTEISNLRSQFTRLIQKDINGEKAKEDKTKLGSNHKEQRVAAHSTIGFYNQFEGKPEHKGDYYFKNKLNDQRGSIENAETDKRSKPADNGLNTNKYHKKYSFQAQQRRDQTTISQVIDPSKIQQLEIEIRKLGDIKHKVEEENAHLKKELTRSEKQFQSRINGLEAENQNLRNLIEQAQISISLKQSLVEKLQNDFSTYKASSKDYQLENQKLKNELQAAQREAKQSISFEKKIRELEAKQKILQQHVLQKEEECSSLKKEKQYTQQQYRDQIKIIETFQNSIKDLQSQHELISQEYKNIQNKYQSLQITTKEEDQQKVKGLQDRIRILEDENTDLKKRVDSYKKTVEQLNSSNNSSREKLVGLKEEVRKAREEAKFLADQLQVKEKLITSLYRDINILDTEIRHSSHFKVALGNHLKYIDELTQRIIELQCSKLNQKYIYLDNEDTQYS